MSRPPGRLGEVVERCLEHDPAQRPSADEVAALVLGSHEPTVARTRVLPVAPEPETPPDPLPAAGRRPPMRRPRWTTALGVALLAAVVALVAIAADRPSGSSPQRPTRLETQSPRAQARELGTWLRAEAHG
jgi:hypothetical protein